MNVDFTQSKDAQAIIHFHCPRYEELPKLDLYADQLISIIGEILAPLCLQEEDKLLTPAMINNYVKQGIVSASTNKKYSRHHLAYLIVVCTFKKMLSIPEICHLIEEQIATYPFEMAYDYFCIELENALKVTFSNELTQMPNLATAETPQTHLIRSTVLAFANKLYIQKYIEFKLS